MSLSSTLASRYDSNEAKGVEGSDFLTLNHGNNKKITQRGQMTLSSLMGYLIPGGKIKELPVTCPRQQMASWTALCRGKSLNLNIPDGQKETRNECIHASLGHAKIKINISGGVGNETRAGRQPIQDMPSSQLPGQAVRA